jgi:hypothetical protein
MHKESIWLYPIGGFLAVLGLAIMVYGVFSSGAPELSDTLNLGLLNDKTNLTIAGGFCFGTGLLCVALESVARRLLNALSGRL